MKALSAATVGLTILGYVLVTFIVQAVSHFAINAEHYAEIAYMRSNPIIALGLLAMLIQGALFGLLFPIFNRSGSAVRNGIVFSWAMGAFLASYIVLAEPGKYAVPSIESWIVVEVSAAAVQYTLFGIVLGLVHRRSPAIAPQPA